MQQPTLFIITTLRSPLQVYLWRPDSHLPLARLSHPSMPDVTTSLCFLQRDTLLVAASRFAERVDVYNLQKVRPKGLAPVVASISVHVSVCKHCP